MGALGPAPERAQPRQHLLEREGLNEVVVGPEVQALDAVADLGGRGEHEDPGWVRPGDERPADLVAVDLGQVAVQDHRVVVDERGPAERRGAVERDVDGPSAPAQAARQGVGQPGLVLGDQDPHRSAVGG